MLATNGQTVQEILGSGRRDQPRPAVHAEAGAADLPDCADRQRRAVHPAGLGQQPAVARDRQPARPPGRPTASSSPARTRPATRSCSSATGSTGHGTPTGTANIRAVYRTGIGSAGMVSAGQLSQPLDRPQGLSSVTNPSAASGAADPATADQARASAPLPTLTIGRVVSLAGLPELRARLRRDRQGAGHLDVVRRPARRLPDRRRRGRRDAQRRRPGRHSPGRRDQARRRSARTAAVVSYLPVLFTFTAAVVVDQPDYAPAQVLAQVWQDLSAAFAFGQRQLGQGVAASEIIEIIQQVPGSPRSSSRRWRRSGAAPPGRRSGHAVRERAAAAGGRAAAAARSGRPRARSGSGHEPRRRAALRAPARRLPHPRRRRAAASCRRCSRVMAAQSGIVEDNIKQLYDDQFIETCAPWVIPYIADLIGYNSIYEIAVGQLRQPRRGRQHDRLPPPQGHAARAGAGARPTSPGAPPSRSRSSGG